jgi:hypothetical protein
MLVVDLRRWIGSPQSSVVPLCDRLEIALEYARVHERVVA